MKPATGPIFTSCTAGDLAWAIWVEWQLRELGYVTLMQHCDHEQGS